MAETPPGGAGKPAVDSAKDAARKARSKEKSDRLRSKIEKTIEHQREVQKRELLRKRLQLANEGVAFMKQGKMADAMRKFHQYLKIMEDWKRVPENGLKPDVFDRKKEMPELLLISAIYWDMARMYDKTRSNSKYREFANALDKYVLFARGMPYQPMAAEAIRKYLQNEKAAHRKEYRGAFIALGGDDRCFFASGLVDVLPPQTLPLLRQYRDQVLAKSVAGQALIALYYRLSPPVATWVATRCPEPIRRSLGRGVVHLTRRLPVVKPRDQ